jgi:hypothetical protein
VKVRKRVVHEVRADGKRIQRLSTKFYAIFVDWSAALRRLPLLKNRRAGENLARIVGRLSDIRGGGEGVGGACGRTDGRTVGENATCQNPVNPVSPPVSLEGTVSKSLVEFYGMNTPNAANATIGPNHAEMPEKPRFLTPQGASDILAVSLGRSGRAAECAGLENR